MPQTSLSKRAISPIDAAFSRLAAAAARVVAALLFVAVAAGRLDALALRLAPRLLPLAAEVLLRVEGALGRRLVAERFLEAEAKKLSC
jgi:hypothetical protein